MIIFKAKGIFATFIMQAYHLIGIMSGTSLDGIDLCYSEFIQSERITHRIIHTKTISYSEGLQDRLNEAHQSSSPELIRLDADLGRLMGSSVNEFIHEFDIKKVDAIASHGHTVFHEPQQGYSTQIGNPAHIYASTGIKTIADFRSVDVALQGQGAPLVPLGDDLLFNEFSYCLNLGGIANLSHRKSRTRIGFDVSICNMALNHLANKIGEPFDMGGNMAESGTICLEMLDEMNDFPFLAKAPPKSLGKEQFLEFYLPILNKFEISIPDALATVVEHIALQISNYLNDGTCLVSGGGAHNHFLLNRLQSKTNCELIVPDDDTINFKEALIFGLLGFLRLTHQPNSMSVVTGASQDSIGGCIYG